jgi:hypothetical protein
MQEMYGVDGIGGPRSPDGSRRSVRSAGEERRREALDHLEEHRFGVLEHSNELVRERGADVPIDEPMIE